MHVPSMPRDSHVLLCRVLPPALITCVAVALLVLSPLPHSTWRTASKSVAQEDSLDHFINIPGDNGGGAITKRKNTSNSDPHAAFGAKPSPTQPLSTGRALSSEEGDRRRRRAGGSELHYLKNPKSGSETMKKILRWSKGNATCKKVTFHPHDFFADHFAHKETFTVVRNPCDRFASQWGFVIARLHSRNRWYRDCDRFYDIQALENSPIAFGEFLLANESAREFLLRTKFKRPLDNYICDTVIFKPQSWWVGPKTTVACLPNLVEDVSRIMECRVPDIVQNKHTISSVPEWMLSDRMCNIAKALYPDDVKIWNTECGAEHGFV